MNTVDTSLGPQVFGKGDLSNEDYHAERGHHSRSSVHRLYRMGGKAQALAERGISLFGGNRGTEIGSLFDEAWDCLVEGRSVGEWLVSPPADVLTSNGQRRGKAYEQWRDELAKTGKRESNADTVSLINLMIEAVMENRSAVELLEKTTDLQQSVFFRHSLGHRLKARFDGSISGELIYDVKTTSSSWSELARSFLNYGYFWQAAWYSDAAYQIGYPQFQMPFIVVQTVPPFECQVFVCPDEFVRAARDQIATALSLIELRRETGEYLPEDYGEVKSLECPAWMWKQEVYGGADEPSRL